ncbi:hypothetical protein TH66_12560 [Carbonactinospora thermoautotrophica]|uniref:GCN5-related N-acetyltransferase n=1 Tax=Carbonactinospora thermoautotrophica TaxID=1469144 RepID=A0A132N0Y8_9ACTN|nr:GNAT family N-acetyltransferase [Carbonactinospora thermoautotrophica]KWX02570.1 GCN5-related N-acetyltransferase [Carbonactinospora thermoautotrophica]KWX03656.1 hypothetical protein TH66_12560 [Carbonactinospora thermoautotrophica]KWX09838.1 hypothetical protein TR74_07210 [Carbonactinospora thermoautotrophica]
MIHIEVTEGPDTRPLASKIEPVYAEVYAEPPYHEGPDDVAGFLEWYDASVGQQRVRVVTAYENDELVGFALGYPLRPGTSWWTRLLDSLPPDFDTTETGTRTLALIELAVRKPWRRQGIGRRLHDAFLDVPDAERATLTVRPEPEAAPARDAYRKWGWRKISRKQPQADGPIYDLMVKDLV